MKINFAFIALVALGSGCNSSKEPVADTSSSIAASSQSSASQNAPVVASDCPHDGKWALCSIERRLKQSGFVVKRVEDTTHRAGFAVKPAVFMLGKSRLEVFFYEDSATAARDAAKLDTLTAGPIGKPSQWGATPPTMIRSANIAAVLLSESPRQIERAINALTAGPPQPGSLR
ncbi:MAG TPA: hypothetical protein VM053_09980 [Gemmatimonadaceae bacterium]|nr:hypothetical protein [Gemmatimonadaceae bacterium]